VEKEVNPGWWPVTSEKEPGGCPALLLLKGCLQFITITRVKKD
jgi:hypothetical protein